MKRISLLLIAMFALLCIQGMAQTYGIWISRAEISALATSGTAWTNLKAAADQSCGAVDLSNQDQSNNVCILAKALVFARTGQSSYRTDTVAALQSIVNMGTYNGRALALGRELGAYVVAADLIDLMNYNPSLDTQFRAKIKSLLTTPTTSGPSNLIDCHEARPNNWGNHCGASRVAVDVYLGDQQDLARAAQVFKGYLGDRAAYVGFSYGELSWQCDPSRPVGINPAGCMKEGHSIDGVLPDDQRRAGTFTWPPPKENYVYEGLQGALMEAVILHREGYDTFNWGNQALLRAFQWLHTQAEFSATGDDSWEPFLVNYFYGTSFPATVGTTPGKNMGWTDWTHSGNYAPPPAVDKTAPTISGVTASVVTTTSATVMWNTNEAADGTIEYGKTTSYGSSGTCGAMAATTHSGTVSGLTPATDYHFRVRSKDAAGNLATSGDYAFKTVSVAPPPPPPLPQQPSADFSGSPTTGQAPLAVNFSDRSTGAPTSWYWNFGDGGTSTVQNPGHTYSAAGQYTVTLIASNAAGSGTATKTNYITTTGSTPPGSCSTISQSWQNTAFTANSGTFTVTFEATPNAAQMDGVIGLSSGAASGYSVLAATVRFYTNGRIEARNGATYTAATRILYTVGAKYKFRIVVRVPSRTYDVYVTPPGAAEVFLARNYAFRPEAAGVTSLSNLAAYAASGSHGVCNLAVK